MIVIKPEFESPDSDAEALFLAPKLKALKAVVEAECPMIRKIWMLMNMPETSSSCIPAIWNMSGH